MIIGTLSITAAEAAEMIIMINSEEGDLLQVCLPRMWATGSNKTVQFSHVYQDRHGV